MYKRQLYLTNFSITILQVPQSIQSKRHIEIPNVNPIAIKTQSGVITRAVQNSDVPQNHFQYQTPDSSATWHKSIPETEIKPLSTFSHKDIYNAIKIEEIS